MNTIMKNLTTLIMILTFTTIWAGPVMTYAAAPEKAPIEIKVRVSEKGFLDEKGKPYSAKRGLQVPKDTPVKITFVFSEELTSLAVGDTHQIAIKSEDGWKQETGSIWIMSREASVSFLAGENGRLQYRAYCILDCIGMEHLTNLLIQVV
ncbi:MAG: hypothetical protein K2X00_06550 [Nitrospiraceae bacterium]|nr:hypothetical protein [Nitrospiraceae bacterium]